MLELKNVSKIIDDKLILRSFSLHVAKGESVAVIGPNGAGKSTFFKCTVGLIQPTSGDILVGGKKSKKNSLELKSKIGFLGHESFLYDNLTPIENLSFYGKLFKVKQLSEKVNKLLKKVGLHYFKDVPIRSFSRGMLQRLAIARVLLAEPELLLLDEPHTGLDQEAISLLNEVIKERQNSGVSIVLITHDFDQVLNVCDKVFVLDRGKVIASDYVKHHASIEDLKGWYEEAVQTK
jgi:heme exporter protein A